jgi:hypothetical protein
MAPHSGWRSYFSRRQLTEGGSGNPRDNFNQIPSPSEWITRAEILCLLTAPHFLRARLLAVRMDMPLHQSDTYAMKGCLEPLHSRATARCASRGLLPTLGAYSSLADIEGDVMIEFLPEELYTA